MNRTIRSAWFGLVVPIAPVVWYLCSAVITNRLLPTIVPIVVFLVLAPVFMFVVLGKKRGPSEVQTDERDNMIRARAMSAGFIAMTVMLVLLCWVMVSAADAECRVNAYMSIPLSVLAFLVSIAVYSAAILVQYGKGGRNNE